MSSLVGDFPFMPTRTTHKHYKKSKDITTLFVVFKLHAVVANVLHQYPGYRPP